MLHQKEAANGYFWETELDLLSSNGSLMAQGEFGKETESPVTEPTV